jgi:glycosyltransferase involved in cell wall biosynthesis
MKVGCSVVKIKTKTALHILLLPSSYPTSSAPVRGVFVQQQAVALRRIGVKVGVIYPYFRSLRDFNIAALSDNHFQINFDEEEGIPTYRFCGWNIPRLRLEPLLWKMQVKRLFKSYVGEYGMPDLIHAHNILWGGFSAMAIGEQTGLPFVVTEHTSSFARGLIQPWQERFIKQVISKSDCLLTVSSKLADQMQTHTKDKKIEVVPNVVDKDYFTPPSKQRDAHLFRILTVALLTPVKGIDVLLKAFAQAFDPNDNVLLEIGGDGIHRKELEKLTAKLHLENRVRFLGLLSREQVLEAMRRSNISVLPSYVETFGVVLIEAMATGLPVVATRCGGPEDIVAPETGWLIEPGNVEELAAVLKNAYLDYHEIKKKESYIRDYAVNHFSGEKIASTLLKHYNNVLK